jgi:3-deoxy-D-manno-octulosonic-acid transferase
MLNYIGYCLYVISTNSFFLLLHIIAPFNKRAKQFVKGRKNIFSHISQSLKDDTKNSIWFHVASLGEFEQARPVIEKLKIIFPNHKYIVTIFSPSGYEIRKNDSIADFIFYLPNDSKKNAKKLVDLFNPELAFWVKYDFWFFYLNELKNQKIPTFLIDASFNSKQVYFKKYAIFYRNILSNFTYTFTQNESSKTLLKNINILNVQNTGDTRFDRVYNALQLTENLDLIKQFKAENLLLVLGSSYAFEVQLLANYLTENKNKNFKIIIAPHFVFEDQLVAIETIFSEKIVRFSKANEICINSFDMLLIDNVGMLSKIYKYADISFIGGGFKPKGLHNILEAATFGNTIVFGNELDYFPEAIEFVKNNAAISVKNQSEFDLNMNNLIKDNSIRKKLGNNAQQQVLKNIGATEKIIDFISKAYLHLN